MSISFQNLLTNHHSNHLYFYSNQIKSSNSLNTQTLSLSISQRFAHKIPLHFHKCSRIPRSDSFRTLNWQLKVFESEGTVQNEGLNQINFDDFLSIAEVLCLVPSAILSVGFGVNWAISKKSLQELVINRVFVWQFGLLMAAVFIGALIRRRQWSRICRNSFRSSGSGINLLERIEKLEEDLKSSATIIRVLSRQLEKLGIRFRVTRKALKEPISEAASLAQKNSEATRALAANGDILEKELGEIQKVLLAMQEQQQKQLELILAIMKTEKPRREIKKEFVPKEHKVDKLNSAPVTKESNQIQTHIQIGDELDIERV